MKIRTDFVTNSSSSSFITITVEMKDGTKVISKNHMDDIGHGIDPIAIAFMEDKDINEMLEHTNNGEDLIKALDDHFHGMFKSCPPSENQLKSELGDIFQKIYAEENQEAIASINSFENVSKIIIEDRWSGDYGKQKSKFVYDPHLKTGKTVNNGRKGSKK